MTEVTDAQVAEPNDTTHAHDAGEASHHVEHQAESTPAETGAEDTGQVEAKKADRLNKRFAEMTREKHELARRIAYLEGLNANRGNADADVHAPDAIEALIEERLAKREHERAAKAAADKFAERVEEVRSKYDDFDDVVFAATNPVTPAMAEAIRDAENGPEIAYHLATNHAEAKRIASLSPLAQAKEIGRLEAKLSQPKAAPKAPPPPPPRTVAGKSTGVSKNPWDMTPDEYYEASRSGALG